jgi:hypothetical protein
MKHKWKIMLAAAGCLMLLANARPSRAQDSTSAPKPTTFWVDQKTGQVFIRPGRGRVPMNFGAPADAAAIEQQVERKTNDKVRAAVAQAQAQQQIHDQELARKVDAMQPAWQSYVSNWQDKFHIGALLYGDYRFYSHAGFQPEELTQLYNPGVGNNNYNSFDITRTYLNFFFFPTPDWTLRLTPNMYRTVGAAPNDAIGKSTGLGSNLDGNIGVRMKYSYLQYANLWNDVPAMKGGTVTAGEIPNPLVAWEEDLYGYRFVNLTPWNYLSLSSTQMGISMEGPVRLFGSEATYLDYGVGVYNNSSFHAFEQTATKEAMGRLSFYPFGADWRFQGLGLTGFYNYGYGNTTPDTINLPTPLKGSNARFERIAALLHYSAARWNIAGEFDYGQNAFSLGNMFSGSGPADAYGSATGPSVTGASTADQSLTGNTACSATSPCYNALASFGPQTAVYRALLQNGRERSLGLDFFGHYQIPDTKLSLFGMFQWFMPNDNVTEDPLDFQRFIAGVAYQYNEYLRFALDSQNVLFYHKQFGMSVAKAATYNYVPGQVFNGRRTPSIGSFVIPNLVPRDTHSIFLNMEFAY